MRGWGWAVLAAVVVLVAWDIRRGDVPSAPRASAASAGRAAGPGDGASGAAPARPGRDPFRYGFERPHDDVPYPEPSRAADHPAATPEAPAPLRLVGFIRQGGELRAALSVLGRVSLVGEGEAVDGYRLVAVEEDVGVRVRSPDGDEQELRLPPR